MDSISELIASLMLFYAGLWLALKGFVRVIESLMGIGHDDP